MIFQYIYAYFFQMMGKYVKILLLITGVLFFYTQTIHSQSQQLKFRHLTTEDGLPSNLINNIMKDSHGMIWVSTVSGLCRYDGYEFKVYQYNPSDTNSLTHNNLANEIIEDINGNLWIPTLWGLNKFNPYTETFTRYNHRSGDSNSLSTGYIRSVYQDKEGIIWIGTGLQGELNKYNPSTDFFKSYRIIPVDTAHLSVIFSIHEDRDGVLWIGSSHGLFQFDSHNETVKPIIPLAQNLPQKLVFRKIIEDKNGKLWFITDFEIFSYDKGEVDPELVNVWSTKIRKNECTIKDIIIDEKGQNQVLWIVTSCKILTINTPSGEQINSWGTHDDQANFTGGGFRSIYKDDSGIIWIATGLGIQILDKQLSQIYQHKSFFHQYQVDATVMIEDKASNFWLGTNGKGVIHFDKDFNPIHHYSVSENNTGNIEPEGVIRVIYEDNSNNIWAGTSRGIFRLSKKANKFEHCHMTGYKNISKPLPFLVFSITEDTHGIIWAGTQSGVYQHNKMSEGSGHFKHVSINNFNLTRPVNSIIEDQNGNLWIGVDAWGLYQRPAGNNSLDSFINYRHEPDNMNSLSFYNIRSIYEATDGTLWIGTRHGLNRYNRNRDNFDRILFESDPGANMIYAIERDNNGNLWLSTEDGLLRYKTRTEKEIIEGLYTLKKFLPLREIRPGKISKLNDGTLFIGGRAQSENGYFTWHPDSIHDNTIIPPIVITDFRIKSKPTDLDSSILFKKHIVLHYYENFFSFKFAALDYTKPEENQYAYYLEGFEDDWIYAENRRTAYYTGVPPGDYIFRVKGCNNDGYWSDEGTSIVITILPPPWKTWWAYSTYGIIVLFLLYLWRRYDLKRQRLQQDLEIEHIEAKKLKELDSMKSRFFANISHEFRTPLTLILGPLQTLLSRTKDNESKQDLNIMERNALRLQNLINQLLNLSKLESGKMKLQVREENIVALINGYVQSFESLARQRNIDLVFSSDEANIQLYTDRDKMEKILYNLLSNAFKFTPEGGRIEVVIRSLQSTVGSPQLAVRSPQAAACEEKTGDWRLKTEGLFTNWIEVSVSDTGPGIPPEKLPHIFDRFYQVDDSYNKDQEGTGIGLALTKELVELHHGIIYVESELGKGTTFTVILPQGKEHLREEDIVIVQNDPYPASSIQNPESDIEYPISNVQYPMSNDLQTTTRNTEPLILIVDDNDDLRTYMRSYLEKEYQITEAIHGKMGMEKATEQVPDLIISDVMMPEMDGYQFCKQIKTDPRTSHIPVILLTARASTESKMEGLETGADDFITKPFDPPELMIRIKNLIQQRLKLRQLFMEKLSQGEELVLFELPLEGITGMDKDFLLKAIQVVEENLSDLDYDTERFSTDMALSRIQLYRKLKALVNHTTAEFIREIRLNKAAELLRNKSATVTQIAYAVGFNTLSYFTKCFKEKFGVLPSEYHNT